MDLGLRDTTAVVGVISDTDGLVRPEVLEALAAIAPVTAVCGPGRFRLPIAGARLRSMPAGSAVKRSSSERE